MQVLFCVYDTMALYSTNVLLLFLFLNLSLVIIFSQILLSRCRFNRKIHVRFRSTRTSADAEIWTSRQKDRIPDQHWHRPSSQHKVVVRTARTGVAKKSLVDTLAFAAAAALRKGQRSDGGRKAELLLERQFRRMRERIVETCWWGWRKQKAGSQIDEDL